METEIDNKIIYEKEKLELNEEKLEMVLLSNGFNNMEIRDTKRLIKIFLVNYTIKKDREAKIKDNNLEILVDNSESIKHLTDLNILIFNQKSGDYKLNLEAIYKLDKEEESN